MRDVNTAEEASCIRDVRQADLQPAGEVLANAFRGYPFFDYYLGADNYERMAQGMFASFVRWTMLYGKAWPTSDLNAVARDFRTRPTFRIDIRDRTRYLAPMTMIVPSDIAYQETKQIKIGGASLPSPYGELAEWINNRYDVHVLNIILDTINPDNRLRLNVILEWAEDERKFHQGQSLNYDKDAQLGVQQQLALLTEKAGQTSSHLAGLFVIFTAFEPVAIVEANSRVTEVEIEHLKNTLADPELWKIRKNFYGVTAFYFTDEQLKSHQAMGAQAIYAREYSKIIHPYDQWGYIQKRGVAVSLDSKENWDTNYRSNWFYYDRDH